MASDAVYLDHNATTPVAEVVLETMLPFLRDAFGNAASAQHAPGRRAAMAVDRAREQVAGLLGARAGENPALFVSVLLPLATAVMRSATTWSGFSVDEPSNVRDGTS